MRWTVHSYGWIQNSRAVFASKEGVWRNVRKNASAAFIVVRDLRKFCLCLSESLGISVLLLF